jgi:aspartyl-tRNA synthetase
MSANPYRTHTCNDLHATLAGQTVRLAGWIHNKRDLGGVLFIDLRDHYGITQIVIPPTAGFQDTLSHLPKETVISVHGNVRLRPEGTVNPNIATGEVEVDVAGYEKLGSCEPLPMNVFPEDHTPEETRLKYRFLDLRRSKLHKTVMLRAKVISAIRRRMIELGFQEFQTPILTSSSPEGARDFLVPSRLYPGEFYALPQAPQQFKQLLMVSGFDRYFQIAPCFRDEDGRADRTPGEFYQLDVEMSFVTQDDVFAAIEKLMVPLFAEFKSDWKINFIPTNPLFEAENRLPELNPDWWKDYLSVASPVEPEPPSASERAFPPEEVPLVNRIFGGQAESPAGDPKVQSAADFIRVAPTILLPHILRDLGRDFPVTDKSALKLRIAPLVKARLSDGKLPIGRGLTDYLTEKIGDELFAQFEKFPARFLRLTYRESMLRFGTDKPDMRIPFEIRDVSPIFAKSEFKAFAGKTVRAMTMAYDKELPRSWFDNLQEEAKKLGAPGLGYAKIELTQAPGNTVIKLVGPIAKFFPGGKEAEILGIQENEIPKEGVVFFSADANETKAAKVLGAMRVKIAEQLNLIEKDVFKFAWIVDYPMYEMNDETKAIEFSHNPFSMPQGGLEALEKQDPLTIFAYQYDLVCNGYEIASGAIRTHIPEIMYKAFALAGHPKEVVDTEFAGMINAFRYGAPPHGGIAPGIDRIVMLLSGETSIREVIAFPMAQNGRDLLMNAPSPVSEKQLRDVHLTIRKPPPKV